VRPLAAVESQPDAQKANLEGNRAGAPDEANDAKPQAADGRVALTLPTPFEFAFSTLRTMGCVVAIPMSLSLAPAG
jgi:hypothetical protein